MRNKVDKFMTEAQQHGFSFEAATQIALHEAQQVKGDNSPQLSFEHWGEFQNVQDVAYTIGKMMNVSSIDLQGEEKAFVKLYKGTVYEVLYTLPSKKSGRKVVIKWGVLFR